MHITWHGNYTIKIQSGESTLVLDPYSPATGLSPFRAKADIVALTNPAEPTMSHLDGIQGMPLLIRHPGEYALRGFTLHALGWNDEAGHERALHRWEIENMLVLHVGALQQEVTDQQLQELEKTDIDILFVPVGGGTGLSTKQAVSLVMKVEPRVVIPIHYQVPGLKEKLDAVDHFAREMGADPAKAEKKLTIKAKHLPEDELVTQILMV